MLITTPATGLRRAFQQLSAPQALQLENSLSTNSRLVAPDGIRSSGIPSFYWQLPAAELGAFLKENPWFSSIPCLILESEKPGTPALNTRKSCVSEMFHLCKDLALKRNEAMGRSRTVSTDDRAFTLIQDFIEEGQAWQAGSPSHPYLSVRQVAELALRFTLLFITLEGKAKPEIVDITLGLELAKRLTVRHLKTLDSRAPVDLAGAVDMRELSSRERAVFLRIVERQGMTRSELSRSFNQLKKDEREEILVSLIGRNLVKLEDGKLWQNAA